MLTLVLHFKVDGVDVGTERVVWARALGSFGRTTAMSRLLCAHEIYRHRRRARRFAQSSVALDHRGALDRWGVLGSIAGRAWLH
jgi:hypothetical protein